MADAPPFAAKVFHVDGVLAEGEPLYYGTVGALLAGDDITFTLDRYKRYLGTKAGRLLNEGQDRICAEGLAFERRTSPGAGPELAERLARFRAKS